MNNIPLCGQTTLFVHSPDDGDLGCVHVLAVMNSATMNTSVHVFVQMYVFTSLVHVPRSGIAGS